ncbi:hypothetical protein BDY24DRAFT_104389 [Mrakia frigida]|uniref:uncharacterized protein n=1 Tax=Mrakia frigida TaxID=29902 RepID=UPI003FCC0C34
MPSTPLHTLLLSTQVFNSSCPWSSEIEQLRELYLSPSTGAVVTRTSTLDGFAQDLKIHGHAFLKSSTSSFNTYGYSPHPLPYYISAVKTILEENPSSTKPFIISITSSSGDELSEMASMIVNLRRELGDLDSKVSRIGIEINTSCPNIPHHPPPAYTPLQSFPSLLSPMLASLPSSQTLGLKLPPYVQIGQFNDLVAYLETTVAVDGSASKISYLACCNTLGGVLGLGSELSDGGEGEFDVDSFAGMGGEAVHPLALGNVHRLSLLLSASPHGSLRTISLIGIGGATDSKSVRRFIKAGATAVACATALGKKGVGIFDELNA